MLLPLLRRRSIPAPVSANQQRPAAPDMTLLRQICDDCQFVPAAQND